MKTMCVRRVLSVLVIATMSLGAFGVSAQAASKKGPKSLVTKAYTEIQKKAQSATSKEALNADVTKVLDRLVNWEAFSGKTMGSVWAELKPEQQTAFIAAYKLLITKKYAGRFKPQPKKAFEVEFRGATTFTKTGAVVKTTVFTHDDGKRVGVDVDYTFVKAKGAYGVTDIVTDTVSRARSYRKKFQALYKKKGFDALVARILKNAARKK